MPERDEHGLPALFYQMKASYTSSSGIYFEEDFGYNAIVKEASQEALTLLKRLEEKKLL